jgi:hypothetical protein
LDKSKPKSYKHFLNVVEDARIEKKIQRRYPGLRGSFKQAYAQFMVRDFFGLKGRDLNELYFIDRLNIFTKSQYSLDITFSPKEMEFVDEIKNVESWEDVVALTNKIFEYSKDEQFEISQNDFNQDFFNSKDDFESVQSDNYDFNEENESDGSLEKNDDKVESGSDENSESESINESESKSEPTNDSESEKPSDKKENSTLNRDKESNQSEKDQFVPECESDQNYRQNERSLLDPESRAYLYLNIPTANMENIVTPYKRVQEQMTQFWSSQLHKDKANKFLKEFKEVNEKYISLLVKEFEMRKAANSYAKNKISTTGDLDLNKLASYRIDDNIFRKIMTVPNGKKHGLILLLDYSGSMSDKIDGSIEQILVLTMFCRKVNIPFRVYAFGDSTTVRMLDYKIDRATANTLKCFSEDENEISLKSVQLREYLNNEMTNFEYNNSLRNMVMLKNHYESIRNHKDYIDRPRSEELTNTPLTQAIFAMTNIMKDFKRNNNLDITNLIIVHDGDADHNTYYNSCSQKQQFNVHGTNVVITDKKTKFSFRLNNQKTKTEYLLLGALNYFKHVTKSNVIGFFVLSSSRYGTNSSLYRRYEEKNSKSGFIEPTVIDAKKKELRENKFIESYNAGYESFYIVAASDMNIEDGEFEIEEGASQRKVISAFKKYSKKRQVSRVLVNRFIQRIAA